MPAVEGADPVTLELVWGALDEHGDLVPARLAWLQTAAAEDVQTVLAAGKVYREIVQLRRAFAEAHAVQAAGQGRG